MNTHPKHNHGTLRYLLDEPVETGEHVENGREVPVDVLMLVQTVELRLHQQDVLREPELQQEVVVHLFKKRDREPLLWVRITLSRIRIRLITLMRIRMRIRILTFV